MNTGKEKEQYSKLAGEIIQYIRMQLSRRMNYLTPVFYSLELFSVEEKEALATDGKYLFYNPAYVIEAYKSSPQKLQAEYLHIISHCLLGHVFKRKGTQVKIYDAAADYVVAAFIGNMGMRSKSEKAALQEISDKKELDKILKSKDLIGLYEFLYHNPIICKELINAGGKLSKDNHDYWNHIHPELAKRLRADSSGQNKAAGISQWYNKYRQDIIKAWETLSFMTDKLAGDSNRAWGNMAGNNSKDYSMSPENNVSYKDFLRRFMVIQEKQRIDHDSFDYAWYTMGLQLYDNIPIIEPLETVEENVADDLIIALDTSGSCIDVMSRFLRESYNILSDIKPDNYFNIRILQCDTRVRDDRVIHGPEDLNDFQQGFEIKGFGGTDFNPVFDYIENLKNTGVIKRVRGLLYLSDGYGDFPAQPPEYETIFIFPPDDNFNPDIPKWITRVKLTENDFEQSI